MKKNWIRNLSLLSAIGGSSLAAAAEPAIPANSYLIKEGDSLSQIAQTIVGSPVFTPNGSLARLLAANPTLTRESALEVGTRIILPEGASAAAAAPELTTYIVKPANTFSEIAQQFLGSPVYPKEGSLERLQALNPQVKNPNRIHVGDILYVSGRGVQLGTNEKPKAGQVERPRRELASVEEPVPDGQAVRSDFALGLGFQYFSIDSTDRATGQRATFLSNASPQVRFTWDMHWSDDWASRVRLDYQKEEVLDVEGTSNVGLQGGKGHRTSFLVGAIRKWSGRSSTGIFVGRDEEIFERAISQNLLKLERVGLPTLTVEQSQVLYSASFASIGAALQGKLYLSAKANSYSTNMGWQLRPKLFLEHDLGLFRARAEAFYGFGRQDSTLVEQKAQSAGVLFEIGKGFSR